MTSDAPVSVAEWPPLGAGGTPSIYGNAQSHFLSTISKETLLQFKLEYLLELGPVTALPVNPLATVLGSSISRESL